MKIFVSWSGKRSRAVAEFMCDWLKCVIQASQPWISTRDIDRGAIWFSEINDKLKDTSIGIVCLTQENKNKPWILFETGALAKGLTTNRVCTFLVDLQSADLQDPLAQFNHTTPDKGSVWELVRTINVCLNEESLDERILKQVFETYWPQFEANFKEAIEFNQPEEVIPPRSEQDILSEILNNTRSLTHRIRDLESQVNYKSNKSNFDINHLHYKSNKLTFNDAADEVMNRHRYMFDSGKYGEIEMIKSLVESGLSTSDAQAILHSFMMKKKLTKKNVSDDN